MTNLPDVEQADADRRGDGPVLLVGTRKGAWLLSADAERRSWTATDPMFLGHIVHHLVLDPRDRRTILAALSTGHLGPTVFRSIDLGRTWQEATRPPAFAAGGDTWEPLAGWNDHPMWETWSEWPEENTPDGSMLHSVIVDPRDPDHLYPGLSAGGVFESTDGGTDWQPLNAGSITAFLPEDEPEFGHDPHAIRLHALAPDRLYQQNHCGIYRMDRPDDRRGVGQRRRRRHLAACAGPSARDLFGRVRRSVGSVPVRVRIPTPLRSYTGQLTVVEGQGATVVEVLTNLDRQFPGIRFRMVDEQGQLRPHMKVFVNQDAIRDLDTAVATTDEVAIMQALSGG